MMRSRPILNRALLLLALTTLGAAAACNRGGSAQGAPAARAAEKDLREAPAKGAASASAAPAVDWTRVSERDLDVASVFLLARDRGVRPALDSLKVLTGHDAGLRARGHELAHALGRFAMARRKDLSLLGECTPWFQSGCYHGALEGWFLQGGTVDPRSIRGICAPPAGREAPGYEQLECWHGLGHGLMARFGGDIRQALPLCDALETERALRECRDGVFMERAIRAVGIASINVGGGPAMRDAHGGHGAGGHAEGGHGAHGASSSAAAAVPREQLPRLCEGIDARYQPSCWAYQPIALLRVHGVNARALLRACDAAPAAAVRDCYQGTGKQYLGAMGGEIEPMLLACRQANAAYAADCLLGGAEYFVDLEWTIEPGAAFCARVPAEAKERCYRFIGERLALIHPRPEALAEGCRRIEIAYAAACRAGAGLPES